MKWQHDKAVTIVIPGTPVPHKNIMGWVGGFPRILTAPASTEYKDIVKSFARKAMEGRPLFGGPLYVKFYLYFPIPESKSKTWKLAALAQKLFHTNKPDADNCQKAAQDGLTGTVCIDDCQITDHYARKRYSDTPHVKIIVTPLEDDPEQGALAL